ncbi:MAG: triose-phosphate isomerase [Pseudobdellovibrionaceae bacterium]
MKKKIIAGNWKLFHTPSQSAQYFKEFLEYQFDFSRYEIVFFPQALSLSAVADQLKKTEKKHDIQFGLQNFWLKNEGAFTGENSLLAASELGCQWALIGHSERRTLFSETSLQVAEKAKFALESKMKPLVCIGETLQEREAGSTLKVLVSQLEPLLAVGLSSFDLAYEPVWAIGTGQVATPAQVAEVHQSLRSWLDQNQFLKTNIVYGGSVKPDNAKGLLGLPHVDGFLVGGASLKPSQFFEIVSSV